MRSLPARFMRLLRHRWFEDVRLRRAFPRTLLEALARRVSASEQHHTGQICVCIEGGLPASYIWRDAGVRERAIMMFAKLRVWDTEHNNGVLIYLLLAERAIEIVADRGIDARVPDTHWNALTHHMSDAFGQGHFEQGMAQALDEVIALLGAHFPRQQGDDVRNELPDAPVVI